MRGFISGILFTVAVALVAVFAFADNDQAAIGREIIRAAEKVIGIDFSTAEIDSMLDDINDNLGSYEALRQVTLPNAVPPALLFDPVPVGRTFDNAREALVMSPPRHRERPADLNALAFYSVGDLGALLRSGQVSSVELTRLYLQRLKKYGPRLECVITLTEELAMEQAERADREIASGKYRGPLHGIPYGAKDLLAVKGYKTTWGAAPYQDQRIEQSATVINKLEAAGAVLVAKLTLGALAWGDVWYGGTTRNPWDLEQGSSGSSAGSASATAAGLVAFAIGTETWGSIVSPSTRCGVTGLRPTPGRVSRTGAMALSWSMDKIGPICRTVEDCALVFSAIIGPDGVDQTLVDLPFNYDPDVDLKDIRIGYLKTLFEKEYPFKQSDAATLGRMRDMGAELRPVELPATPVAPLAIILVAEAAAAFDELTRSGEDDLLVRQIKNAWPNVFRSSRFIPAVEYIQANRVRYQLIQEMEEMDVDVYVSPSFGGDNLLLTNLTGHPCVVVPNGFDETGHPVSITFIGRLYDEATVLAVAKKYQDSEPYMDMHPEGFN